MRTDVGESVVAYYKVSKNPISETGVIHGKQKIRRPRYELETFLI
jgi:hypothetical protein